ncbi:peptidase M16C associated-domain-containing protein [Dipodascopsis tothii]|uniref:peptidase M16C associated-domain-containing protein n=1 Tax=Dipodascopsis tothii TaxID=44089 RepID=UPI0034D01A57
MSGSLLLRSYRASGSRSVARRNPRITGNKSRHFASLLDVENKYQTGTRLHGYTVERVQHVPEFDLVAVKLRHDLTGAEHLHIARDDKNNVFSMGFKTYPPDATGVPHILEHTTLCGSQRYQVRDPFFKMLNRSLANFMNAMTASDYTFYPFATTNQVDFSNLRSVYLDATLNPLLRELDFKQEGWRLEHSDPRDRKSPLIFKGVVYNEMKGQMSDASYLYYIKFQEAIYPSLHNSGGDPSKITDLTYDGLKNFHAEHYHPSNAKVFTYGSFPLEDHLEDLNTSFSRFVSRDCEYALKYPVELKGSKRVSEIGPFDPMLDPERQYKTSLTWYMGNSLDLYESFCLRIATTLLTDGYASPLYQALIDSHLGTEFTPNTGFDTGAAVNLFSVGLQGISKENVAIVEDKIIEVLKTTLADGFDRNRVNAILHQMEISRKHKEANFGMTLLYSLTSGWFNKQDPFEILEWDSVLNRFRNDLNNPRFLESLVEKYLTEEQPIFYFTMNPNDSYSDVIAQEEQTRLTKKISSLTDESRSAIYDLGLQLLEKQEQREDLSSLPTLHVSDIPQRIDAVALQHTNVQTQSESDIAVQWRVAPTNGLTYFRAVVPLSHLPEDLHAYLPLFTDALTSLGTVLQTMAEIEDEIKSKTGGIDVGFQVHTSPHDIDDWGLNVTISGYCLDSNVPAMLQLLNTLLTETNFDNTDKLRSLIRGLASGSVNSIAERGHAYARNVASSVLTASARLSEALSGIQQVKFIADLDSYDDASLPLISEKLKEIAAYAITNHRMRIAVTCGSDSVSKNEAAIKTFVNSLPPKRISTGIDSRVSLSQMSRDSASKICYPMPFQVSYTGAALKGVPYVHPEGASLQVLANMLTHKHLHGEIREKGGAYGGGASYGGLTGIFNFYSYRDPSPENTFKVIDSAGSFAVSNSWTERDLEEAKLSIFQSIDAPRSINSEGLGNFFDGIDDSMRQSRRSALLGVTVDDVKSAASKYLVSSSGCSYALLGEKKAFVGEDWTVTEIGGATAI